MSHCNSWGEPERAPHGLVVDACVVRTSRAQKFTLQTRKASHWLVVNAYVVHTSRARNSTIRKRKAPLGRLQVSHVRKKALTHGAAWQLEKSASGTEGSVID